MINTGFQYSSGGAEWRNNPLTHICITIRMYVSSFYMGNVPKIMTHEIHQHDHGIGQKNEAVLEKMSVEKKPIHFPYM